MSNFRFGLAALSVLVACTLGASCGNGSSNSNSSDIESDPGSAQTKVLELSDFPSGWVHRPWDQEAIDQFRSLPAWKHCYQEKTLPGETDRAYGGEYSDKNTTLRSINPAVFVFDSEANAKRGIDGLINEYECFAGVVGDGLAVNESFAMGETNVKALPEEMYDATSAIRVTNTQIYKTSVPPDSDVLVFDVVYIAAGRVVSEVTGFQRHTPIDQEFLREYVEKARLKIGQND